MLVNVRVSDFLRQQSGLVVMRQCIFAPMPPAEQIPRPRELPLVIVNVSCAPGIAEWISQE